MFILASIDGGLEEELQSALQHAAGVQGTCDDARRCRANRRTWRRKGRMIRDVERFAANFQAPCFGEDNVLLEREVDIVQVVGPQNIAA